jgi:hypothetical protein
MQQPSSCSEQHEDATSSHGACELVGRSGSGPRVCSTAVSWSLGQRCSVESLSGRIQTRRHRHGPLAASPSACGECGLQTGERTTRAHRKDKHHPPRPRSQGLGVANDCMLTGSISLSPDSCLTLPASRGAAGSTSQPSSSSSGQQQERRRQQRSSPAIDPQAFDDGVDEEGTTAAASWDPAPHAATSGSGRNGAQGQHRSMGHEQNGLHQNSMQQMLIMEDEELLVMRDASQLISEEASSSTRSSSPGRSWQGSRISSARLNLQRPPSRNPASSNGNNSLHAGGRVQPRAAAPQPIPPAPQPPSSESAMQQMLHLHDHEAFSFFTEEEHAAAGEDQSTNPLAYSSYSSDDEYPPEAPTHLGRHHAASLRSPTLKQQQQQQQLLGAEQAPARSRRRRGFRFTVSKTSTDDLFAPMAPPAASAASHAVPQLQLHYDTAPQQQQQQQQQYQQQQGWAPAAHSPAPALDTLYRVHIDASDAEALAAPVLHLHCSLDGGHTWWSQPLVRSKGRHRPLLAAQLAPPKQIRRALLQQQQQCGNVSSSSSSSSSSAAPQPQVLLRVSDEPFRSGSRPPAGAHRNPQPSPCSDACAHPQ